MLHDPNGLTQSEEKGSLKVKSIPVIAGLLILASLIFSRTDSLRTGGEPASRIRLTAAGILGDVEKNRESARMTILSVLIILYLSGREKIVS